MTTNTHLPGEEIRAMYSSAHKEFHALLASITEEDWHKQSLNSGWSNGEIIAHILFGFIILRVLLPMSRIWGRFPRATSKPFAKFLNWMTRPFNWVNGLGARGQSKVFTYHRIGKIFDQIHASLLLQMSTIEDSEWQAGMYYPTKWDPNFSDFMTIEALLRYPIAHFKFHRSQIAYPGNVDCG